jgi:hypothetical protein
VTDRPPEQTEAEATQDEATQDEATQDEATQDEAAEGAPTGAKPVAVAPTEEERRRRRAVVFGDVLPEVTSDDRADASERGAGSGADEWLRREVPPHHG